MKVKDEVTAFQLGSSTVVTLPKEFGIRPGSKLRIEKNKEKIILKRKKISREGEIRKLVNSLAGGLRLKPGLTPEEIKEELDRRYEERYEQMLPGH